MKLPYNVHFQNTQWGILCQVNNFLYFNMWLNQFELNEKIKLIEHTSFLGNEKSLLRFIIDDKIFEPFETVASLDENEHSKNGFGNEMRHIILTEIRSWSPQLYRNTIKSLFAKNHTFDKLIKEKLLNLNYLTTCDIGVHIRGGDKFDGESQHIPIQVYVDEASKILSRSGNKENYKVFVMSDDQTLLQSFKSLAPHNWNVVFFPTNCRKNGGHRQSTFNKQDLEHKLDNIVEMFTEIEIMYNCSHILGTSSSNIFRFIYSTFPDQDSNSNFATSLDWNLHFVN